MSEREIKTTGGCVQLSCILDTEEDDLSVAEKWLQECADKVNDELANTMTHLTLFGHASVYTCDCHKKKSEQ